MHLAVLDDGVPAVQAELARLHTRAHHRVVHQAFEPKDDGALFGASQRLGARFGHWQHGFAAELQPLHQILRRGVDFTIQRADAAVMAVAADDDVCDFQVQHRELDRGRRAVEACRAVAGQHEGTDIAHQEQLTEAGAREQLGHEP